MPWAGAANRQGALSQGEMLPGWRSARAGAHVAQSEGEGAHVTTRPSSNPSRSANPNPALSGYEWTAYDASDNQGQGVLPVSQEVSLSGSYS